MLFSMVSLLEACTGSVLGEAWDGMAHEHWVVDEYVFAMGLKGRDGQIAGWRQSRRRSGRTDALVGAYHRCPACS